MENNLEQRVATLEKLLQHTHDGVNSHVVDYTNLFNIGGGDFYVGQDEKAAGATTTQAITGVGFTPKAVIFFAGKDNDTSMGWSVGMASGTASANNAYLKRAIVGGNMINFVGTTYCINVQDDDGDWSTADIDSFDDDGFTLNWVNLDESVKFAYLCFG